MIRHEWLLTTIRFYSHETTDPFQPYDAICTLTWETPTVVWIQGLKGTMQPQHWVDLHDFLFSVGVRTAKCYTSDKIKIPFEGTRDGEIMSFGPAHDPEIEPIACVGGAHQFRSLRHTVNTSLVRFYNHADPDWYASYDAICTFTWESPTVVWMIGLHGTLSRKVLRQLTQLFLLHGVQLVKAHRAPDRTLPFVTSRDGTYVQINIADVFARLSRHKVTPK
jgi:hypothetical protein